VDIQIPTPPTPPVTPPTDTIVTPPIDPNEELKKEIAKLEKDSTEATDNCRTARHDAIYNPEDISSKWNVIFSAGGDFYANNFKDTIDRDTIVVNTLYTNYGDPLPSNDQSIKAYKGSIISWNDVVATLANKRNQLTK
jgi:hypothetical protein